MARHRKKGGERKDNMPDFFKKEEEVVEEKKEEVKLETIKVGEKEYTQEELSRKVGLGELADELETKWNTKIDKLYPEYTKATQERGELQKYKDEQERLATEAKAKKGEELTPEEIKKQALTEADNLGVVHTGNINKFIGSFLQARDLIDDAEAILTRAGEEGKPKTTVDDLLTYMDETGIKSPDLAYKAKFDKELDTWKQTQLAKVKSGDMQTLDSSTAGGKEPEIPKLTNIDSLRDAMKSRFNRT